MSIINEASLRDQLPYAQVSLKVDNRPALVILTPSVAQVPHIFTLMTTYAMEHMADAYLAEVANPDLDIESDKCTLDYIVRGTQSNSNTESKSAEQRANQGTKSCT